MDMFIEKEYLIFLDKFEFANLFLRAIVAFTMLHFYDSYVCVYWCVFMCVCACVCVMCELICVSACI